MRIQEHANKLETNVEAESQNFGIGDASVVIEILRNRLYENKVQTLVQEYICNARDAMREVGNKAPFEVTVPTRLNPVFKVRDFGPGISPDRMRDVFVMYGSSTKRGTNNQTGGFGIGAKSAWSYTDSFTIVSVVSGQRRTYIAHTGVNNNGRLDLVSTDKTDEANGTEIQVAVKGTDIDEFRNAVFRAIYFWDKKPKLKGELNPPTLVSGHRIGDVVEVVRGEMMPEYCRVNSYNQEMMAVIDGIPYPIPQKLIQKVPNLQKLSDLIKREVILHFGNGVVEVSASRESIADSKRTIDALSKLAGKATLEVSTYITDAFGKVADTAAYLNTYAKMSGDFEVDKFAKFGSYEIDGGWITGDLLKKIRITMVSCLNRRGHRIEKVSKTELHQESKKQIKIENLNNLFYATVAESKVQQNKRIREYLKSYTQLFIIEPLLNIVYDTTTNKDGTTTQTIKSKTLDTKSFDQVVSDLGVKDFQTITYVDLPKDQKVKVLRENEEFCYSRLGYHRYQYTTLAKNTQKWLYIELEGNKWGKYDSTELSELSEYLNGTEQLKICGLAGRALKMVQGDKNYAPLKEWLDSYKPSKTDILISKRKASKQMEIGEVISKLKDIKDKFLVEMGEEYRALRKLDSSKLPGLIANRIGELQEIKDFVANDTEFGKLIRSDYPLLKEIGYCTNWTELSFYANAKYEGR